MAFDHELKMARAFKHLQDLNVEIDGWISGHHYTVRQEYDADAKWDGPVPPGNTPAATTNYLERAIEIRDQDFRVIDGGFEFGLGRATTYVSTEQPPHDTIGVLVGDVLHNLRSGLDNLAYELMSANVTSITEEVARSSEFPIFGDEDRQGNTGVGAARFNAHAGVNSWHPLAKTAVERLQPYQRGNAFRRHPLWLLHELDNIDKHRLIHTTFASFGGVFWNVRGFKNIGRLGPGVIQTFGGRIQPDTPISVIYGVHPIDPNAEMHVEIGPSMEVALSEETPVAGGAPVLRVLGTVSAYVRGVVLPTLTRFLYP